MSYTDLRYNTAVSRRGYYYVTCMSFFAENDSVFKCANSRLEEEKVLPVVQYLGHLEEGAVCWSKSLHLCHHTFSSSCECMWVWQQWDSHTHIEKLRVQITMFLTHPPPLQFIHCLLILVCLCVLCYVKPYKKYHINVTEMLVLLSLFGATVCILDENDLHIGPIVSTVFIAFPFLYGLVFIAYRATRKIVIACW